MALFPGEGIASMLSVPSNGHRVDWAPHCLPLLLFEDMLSLLEVLLVSLWVFILLFVQINSVLIRFVSWREELEKVVDWPHRHHEEEGAKHILRVVPSMVEMLEQIRGFVSVYLVENTHEWQGWKEVQKDREGCQVVGVLQYLHVNEQDNREVDKTSDQPKVGCFSAMDLVNFSLTHICFESVNLCCVLHSGEATKENNWALNNSVHKPFPEYLLGE